MTHDRARRKFQTMARAGDKKKIIIKHAVGRDDRENKGFSLQTKHCAETDRKRSWPGRNLVGKQARWGAANTKILRG